MNLPAKQYAISGLQLRSYNSQLSSELSFSADIMVSSYRRAGVTCDLIAHHSSLLRDVAADTSSSEPVFNITVLDIIFFPEQNAVRSSVTIVEFAEGDSVHLRTV